jgi:hypothetical protein
MRHLTLDVLTRTGGLSRREARDLLDEPAISSELARLTAEIEAQPESAASYGERGRFLARTGRWRESAADFVRETQLVPEDRLAWMRTATSLLLAGDEEGYAQHCRAMVAQFRASTGVEIADVVCKSCLLRPGTIELSELPIQNVRDPVGDPTWEPYRHYFQACLALIAYRQGDYGEAVARTGRLSTLTGVAGTLALIVRAMAEQQLGQHEQARQTLAQAEIQIPVELRTLGTDDYDGPLPVSAITVSHDWLIPEILRRETAELIGDKQAGPEK